MMETTREKIEDDDSGIGYEIKKKFDSSLYG